MKNEKQLNDFVFILFKKKNICCRNCRSIEIVENLHMMTFFGINILFYCDRGINILFCAVINFQHRFHFSLNCPSKIPINRKTKKDINAKKMLPWSIVLNKLHQ